jgi:tetratricopeptide (TPR) repeat protein
MHLTDRATNILARLLAEPALREGSLILIGHRLGGLVIKQLLRTAGGEARHRDDAAKLIARVEKVAFLGTPHTGSGLANLGDWLRIVVRPSAATICLVRNDPNLRDLNLWYRDWANSRNISHLVLTETKPLRILGMMVKPDSSDPGLAGTRPIPIDGTHWTLCKPNDPKSEAYVHVAAFIERRFERPKAPGEERLDALSEGQRGLVLWRLGERESGTAKFEEAVTTYREALKEFTRERVPLDWAQTQNNLGNALRALGERESGTAKLEEAVAAYREALKERSRERAPLDWAQTQNNLGNALRALGERESGTAKLEEAVTAYRETLKERTRDRVPLQWAISLGNQGIALMHLAERLGDAAMAETAHGQSIRRS